MPEEEHRRRRARRISRRKVLEGAAGLAAGGAVALWRKPALLSLHLTGFQASVPSIPPGPSYVALCVKCGRTTYRVKFNAGNPTPECGSSFATPSCTSQFGCNPTTQACPPGITGGTVVNGNMTVSTPGCTIKSF